MGVLTQVCVKATAIDAIKLGYKVNLLIGCVGSKTDIYAKQSIEEMKRMGINAIKSSDLCKN